MMNRCPHCNSHSGIHTNPNIQYCFACHWKGDTLKSLDLVYKKNQDLESKLELPIIQDTLPDNALKWLYQYHITQKNIHEFNIYWSNQYSRIVFSYNNNKAFWTRSINSYSPRKWLFFGDPEILWVYNKERLANSDRSLCIVEDVISAIRVSEFMDTLCLGGTNISNKYVNSLLCKYDKIYLWLDGDNAGKSGTDKFYIHFKLLHNINLISTKKDPKCFKPEEIKSILNIC